MFVCYVFFFVCFFFFFFFNDTSTTEIYTLSLHDALPIYLPPREISMKDVFRSGDSSKKFKIAESPERKDRKSGSAGMPRPISYAVFCLKKKKEKKTTISQTGHISHTTTTKTTSTQYAHMR